MPGELSPSLQEHVSHVTDYRPISFHHTVVAPGTNLVLYLHWHCEIEFLYIKDGECVFIIEEQEYHLKTGDAIFIPPNLLHMAKSIQGAGCEFYAVVFAPNFLFESYTSQQYMKYMQPFIQNNLRFSLHITPNVLWQEKMLSFLKDSFLISQKEIDLWELEIRGTFLILWQMLYNHHLSQIHIPWKQQKLSIQLSPALDFIHNFYYEDITLLHLAELCNISEGQFCRLFKQLTGLTPFSYINRYRIFKSCEYLLNTSKKVAEIATLCGFNNISYFNREFVKIMKTTPSNYRITMR